MAALRRKPQRDVSVGERHRLERELQKLRERRRARRKERAADRRVWDEVADEVHRHRSRTPSLHGDVARAALGAAAELAEAREAFTREREHTNALRRQNDELRQAVRRELQAVLEDIAQSKWSRGVVPQVGIFGLVRKRLEAAGGRLDVETELDQVEREHRAATAQLQDLQRRKDAGELVDVATLDPARTAEVARELTQPGLVDRERRRVVHELLEHAQRLGDAIELLRALDCQVRATVHHTDGTTSIELHRLSGELELEVEHVRRVEPRPPARAAVPAKASPGRSEPIDADVAADPRA